MTAAEDAVGGDAGGGALAELSPSAKLAAKVLEEEGAMPFDRLVRCTRLPRETARYAVDRLVEAGVAERRLAPEGDESGDRTVVVGLAAEGQAP